MSRSLRDTADTAVTRRARANYSHGARACTRLTNLAAGKSEAERGWSNAQARVPRSVVDVAGEGSDRERGQTSLRVGPVRPQSLWSARGQRLPGRARRGCSAPQTGLKRPKNTTATTPNSSRLGWRCTRCGMLSAARRKRSESQCASPRSRPPPFFRESGEKKAEKNLGWGNTPLTKIYFTNTVHSEHQDLRENKFSP
jgi:hypothetical protein